MKFKIKLYHLPLFGALMLGSCQKEYVKPAPHPVITTAVSFSVDIAPTLITSCGKSGCHDGGTDPNLTTIQSAYTSLTTGMTSNSNTNGVPYINSSSPANSPFYLRIIGSTDGDQMPADGPPYLTAAYQAKILAWITQGAKNN